MSYRRIRYEKTGDVAVIRLNHPETLNAISVEMGFELTAAVEQAAGEARAVMLGGEGRAFSSGANLAGGDANLLSPDRDLGGPLEAQFNPMMKALRDLPIPLVVAVKGAAAGIGCSIALIGDVIVAGNSAYFLQAFCNIGLIPDGGSPYLLARAIGRVRAMELMLLGERYPADRAYADGLVTRIVDDDKVDETAMEYAERLAAGPTKAYGLIKKSAWAALDSPLDEQLDRERRFQLVAGRTEDMIEGVSAFLEKRKPKFKGR